MSTPAELAAAYQVRAVAQAPRILGLGDREPASSTYGCFDRSYWHYRLKDFADAQQQQAALFLALLSEARGTPYHRRPRVREWALAATRFWGELVHGDGSLDEAYPNERGYCATSMSTAAVTAALARLDAEGPSGALDRAAGWLASHEPPPVSNQIAAATLALAHRAARTGQSRWRDAAEASLAALLRGQDADGFFPEYGGQDTGYQSLTLAILAEVGAALEAEERIAAPLRRGAEAVAGRLDELGHHDPQANSRRTQFLYPSGLAAAGRLDLLQRHVRGLEADAVLEPAWLDDRYVIWLSIDYLRAAQRLYTAPAEGVSV